MKSFLKNSAIVFILLGLATFLSYLFSYFAFQEATSMITYMLAVIIISQTTSTYMYGLLASLVSVLAFNLFFTYPLYTFKVFQPEYLFMFFVMFVISFLSSSLTIKLKTEKTVAQERTRQVLLMEGINHVFRSISTPDALNAASRIISESFSANVVIEITLNGQHIECETILNKELNSTKQNKTPITLNNKNIGSLCLWTVQIITQTNLEPIANALSQNIEKLDLIEKQNIAELKIREQKLRNDLLGAISHDLRTPLATIIGSSDTLIENQTKLNEADQLLLLNNIKDDSTWLMNSVENILSLMRVDEGFSLNTRIESIEELFGDVLSRVVAYSNAEIQMHLPAEPIYYAMDIQLMEKVLLNLIDNAHKYSVKGSKIGLTAFVNQDSLVFEVSDEGQGIPNEQKKKIFDRFYTYKTDNTFNRRGLGLGLAICKSIVEAHHGRILVKDNKPHGTIMHCVFPYKELKNENRNH